jgi:hypothetical protein
LLPESPAGAKEQGTGVFAPWSITGFDKTTQRRMRIEPDIFYRIFRVTESKTVVTSLQELESLTSCFSSREAALTDRLLLCFFTVEDKITGVLIIADSPYLELHDSILRLFFAVVTQITSSGLARSRSSRLRRRKDHGEVRKDRFLASLKTYAENLPEDASLAVFTVDAKPIVKEIRESHPDIDEYRILQDITAVMETLFAGYPVFMSSVKKKILAVTQAGKFDSRLLVHQISLRMRKLFQNAKNVAEKESGAADYGGAAITENSLPGREIPDDVIARFL